jgi:hypothetical protein
MGLMVPIEDGRRLAGDGAAATIDVATNRFGVCVTRDWSVAAGLADCFVRDCHLPCH